MGARRRCPACGGQPIPVVVGEPTWEAMQASERGEVSLAGCLPPTYDDEWQKGFWECRACERRWVGKVGAERVVYEPDKEEQ